MEATVADAMTGLPGIGTSVAASRLTCTASSTSIVAKSGCPAEPQNRETRLENDLGIQQRSTWRRPPVPVRVPPTSSGRLADAGKRPLQPSPRTRPHRRVRLLACDLDHRRVPLDRHFLARTNTREVSSQLQLVGERFPHDVVAVLIDGRNQLFGVTVN